MRPCLPHTYHGLSYDSALKDAPSCSVPIWYTSYNLLRSLYCTIMLVLWRMKRLSGSFRIAIADITDIGHQEKCWSICHSWESRMECLVDCTCNIKIMSEHELHSHPNNSKSFSVFMLLCTSVTFPSIPFQLVRPDILSTFHHEFLTIHFWYKYAIRYSAS